MSRVEIRGADGVHKMLEVYTDPKLRKRLQKAVSAGAKEYVPPLRAEARKVSKRMGRAVTSNQSGRGIRGTSEARKTVGREPRAFVGFNIKRAFFSHMVVGGTKDHGPRRARALMFTAKGGNLVVAHRVKGVQPNPMVARVASSHEGEAYAAIDRSLDQTE